MWQSGDQYSQWALNPSAYQNVAHDKVDWAALAQQWIQMKDTQPEDQVSATPPPPSQAKPEEKKKEMDVEGGEAPMEMEKEDLENTEVQEAPSWGAWNNWQQWGQWGWNASGVDPNGSVANVPPPTPAAIIAKQSGMVGNAVPVPGYTYSPNAPAFGAPPGGNFDYNEAPVTEPYNQVMVGGYWTAGPSGDAAGNNLPGQAHGPAPFIRNNRPDWRRPGRGGHDRTRAPDKSDEEEDTTIALDAAKRKQLPAWIREGLEKMEREKQKKIDRDRQMKERELFLQKKREEEEALNQLQPNNSGQPTVPKKSKFESDSEDSDQGDNRVMSPISTSRRKSRFRNADSPTSSPLATRVRDPTPELEPVKTQEEILHDRMLKVRRLLTEILLEVTTEEMESVAQEVLSKAKAKAPALQLRKTPALASLTGKLGLGMYGDSDESDSDASSDDRNGQANGADSDEELKDQIQRRKQEFLKTEREIEARLLEEEEKERARERRLTADATDDDTGDERQVEKHSDSKRQITEDGIRFKEEQEKPSRSGNQSELENEEENSHNSNSDLCSPFIKKEKSEETSDHSSDRKHKHQEEIYKALDKSKRERSVSSDENEESSSNKSDSDDSSSSKSASSSSDESRRSSKKSSKSTHLKGHEKLRRKKRSDSYDRKHKKSDKRQGRSKDKRHDYESGELRIKEKKREKHRKSRSRSRSGRSFSKETKVKRNYSGESRRSKRSRSRESYRSKTSHHDSQSVSHGGERYSHSKHGVHKGHSSRSKDKNHKSHSKESNSYKYRDSYSPFKEKKSTSSSKRQRDSSLSRSRSPSKNRRYSDRKENASQYSRSRSNSSQSRSQKKPRRHHSSSSSDGSTIEAKGKAAGR